ncbi:YtzH-like family protein [Oceanobacillus halotolerans]|uniref:YtzH-like family protein n=1 Tax=Oceanobacillus halotolerans TaxID=2663380 RepID=UPI0013D908E3|nr:YtzH-like family protein [Oceanobacillus halotolerans]
MGLNVDDQLMLLHDILSEQSEDCCANVSEHQQIKRLVKAMMANNSISDEQLLQLLPEIYNYGREGEVVQNMEEHITTNQPNLETWMHAIEQTKLK